MVETTMNVFDLGVIVIVGLSALLSFFRGFTREVLSLGAWLVAAIVTLYTFPTVSQWIEPQVKNPAVASGLAAMGVFFTSLVLFSILTGLVVKFMKTGAEVGVLDNIIGLIFGAARGVLLVAIAYFMMTIVIAEKDYPVWIKGSMTQPYVAKASVWVAKLAPSYLDAIAGPKGKETADSAALKKTLERHADTLQKQADDAPSFEELQRRMRQENEAR